MPLSDIVTVSITSATAGLTQEGFGTPMILSPRPSWSERVRSYESLAAMSSDGFTAYTPEYLAAAEIFAQSPRVESLMVGRCALPPTQRFALTPVAVDDDTYSLTVIDPTGASNVVTYTQDSMLDLPYATQTANFTAGKTVTGASSGAKAIIISDTDAGTTGTLRVVGVRGTFTNGEIIADNNGSPGSATLGTQAAVTGVSATVAEIVNGLRSKIDALGLGLTCSDQTTYLRVLANTAGVFHSLQVAAPEKLGIAQDHADPGIGTDLANIALENSEWYGIVHLYNSKACIDSVTTFAAANKKLFIAQTQDSAVVTTAISGTDDVAEANKSAANRRTAIIYHPKTAAFADAAWLGKCLPFDPGSETWKFKTLTGVSAVGLTNTHLTNLRAKTCNFYYTVAGRNITAEGLVGSVEFIDTIRGLDWFEARLGERIMLLLSNATKVPFTDAGIARVEGEVRAQLVDGVDAGFLAPGFTVTVPKAADVSSLDKAARLLPDIEFTATLAGAIHKVTINGVISV